MTDVAGRDGLALDDQLCFALYAASRAVTACYRPLLANLGLTYPQYLVLLVLWEADLAGEQVTVSALGDRLMLDSGTLSPLLKRLESAGVVTRQRRGDDERRVDVVLTERGRSLRQRAEGLPPAIATAMGLTPDELAELRTTLRALTERLQAHLLSQPAVD